MNSTTHRLKGIALVVIGAMLWGATGPMMEWVLSSSNITVPFMLTFRLLLAGILLLIFLMIKKVDIFAIWKQKYWWKRLILFGVIGMLGVQFTFVTTIKESNAVFATLLQFLAPIFIILYVSLKHKLAPPKFQVIGIIVTFFGLFLLLTNGSIDRLLVSPIAILWGIALGLAFSFYTVFPTSLMNEWGVLQVVGWGMFIGGVVLGLTNGFWKVNQYRYLVDPELTWMLIAIIIIGTLAFVLFLSSLKYITPVETSVLSCMEPLTAMMISVIWLGQVIALWQIVGIIIMLTGVTWLSIEGDRRAKMNKVPKKI